MDLPTIETAPDTEPKLPHRAFRERAEERRKKVTMAAAGSAWGGLGVAVAGALVAVVLFRADIVSLWPQASSAYAMVGLETNPYGVTIEDFTVTRMTDGDVPGVMIEGVVRNVDRRDREAPALRAMLLDEHSDTLLEWTVLVNGGDLRSGETRAFQTIVSDPPHAATYAEITLAGLDYETPPVTPPEHADPEDDAAPQHIADAGH
tara:strand:+ start:1260 stop:1874 length:615 start_codon:yes stop_codon:yes gene_type:complete